MDILHRIQHPAAAQATDTVEAPTDAQESMVRAQAEKLAQDVRKTEEKASFEEVRARYAAPDMNGKDGASESAAPEDVDTEQV